MLIKDVRALTELERLLYWVRERESVRLKKERGDRPPFTDDEILQRYRFTNVRRMDDAVSQWLLKNWYEPHKDHPNILAAAVLARHFNLPTTLDAIGMFVFRKGPLQWTTISKVVRALKAAGNTVFNGAYMVRGIGTVDKTEMVVDRVARPVHEADALLPFTYCTYMELCHEKLLPYWGFSDFMAGQVVADLRWAVTGLWTDKEYWAPIGPGSRRGMNRIHGRPPKQSLSSEEFRTELQSLICLGKKQLPSSITSRMEAMDWQSVCCEFDKYERALWGQGRPKQLYRGAV